MKKTTIIFVLNLLTIVLVAQSNVRLNNFWEKSYTINPASVNDRYFAEFNMAGRKQWVDFPGAPTTFFASGTMFLDKLNTQFGLKAFQDKIGYTSTTNVGLTYAYALILNRDWHLNMGLGLNFQSVGYDLSHVNSQTPGDPTVYSRLLNENNFNSDLGVELQGKKWQFGVASQNLLSLFKPINSQFSNTNFIYTKYRQNTQEHINLGFGACGVQYGSFYQMELNLTSYFKLNPESNGFQLGIFYRTYSEVGMMLGLDIAHNLHLSYSYDYNVGAISRSSYGSHEIMLTYNLDRVFQCLNCWY
jgi:type IX secretion system PorP/SprF family membrane protein